MKEMKIIAGGLILVMLILTGCTTTQKGAGIGAATGAVLGTWSSRGGSNRSSYWEKASGAGSTERTQNHAVEGSDRKP